MRRFFGSLALLTAVASSGSAQTVLKFDDIFSGTTFAITNEYSSVGVTFVGGALAFCLNNPASPSCSNTSWGSGPEAAAATIRGTEKAGMFWQTGTPIMNSSTGFTTGFSFFYSNPFAVASTFEVWSGLDATGSLLATFALGGTNNGVGDPACYNANYCSFVAGGVAFAGTAQSVRFLGGADRIVYDDITFGSVTPGTTVPEPSTLALVGAALLALPLVRRRRA